MEAGVAAGTTCSGPGLPGAGRSTSAGRDFRKARLELPGSNAQFVHTRIHKLGLEAYPHKTPTDGTPLALAARISTAGSPTITAAIGEDRQLRGDDERSGYGSLRRSQPNAARRSLKTLTLSGPDSVKA